MKKYLIYIILIIVSSSVIVSCTEDDPLVTNEPGVINFKFNHKVGTTPLVRNAVIYDNDAGNVYSVSTLKYYISNIVLTRIDDITHSPRSYYLVDTEFPDGTEFRMIDIPPGEYKSISFSIGVDPIANSSGDQQGALDPINGMFWSWSTGYIFTKIEGKYINKIGDETNYLYHIGLDSNRIDMTVPVKFLLVGDNPQRNMNVEVDVNKFFSGAYEYDIETDGDKSETFNFPQRAFKIRQNMKGAFKLTVQ